MAKRRKKLKIPTREIVNLIGALLAAGNPPEEIPRLVGAFFDDLLAFDEIVKGPVGVGLEAIDGPVFTAAARVILTLIPRKRLIARAQQTAAA